MTGITDVAFDMIETLYLKAGKSIVGLYEAALPNTIAGEGRAQT